MEKTKLQWLKERVQQHQMVIGVVVLFFVVLFGYIILSQSNQTEFQQLELDNEEQILASEELSESQSSEVEVIYVDIKGEIQYPGVYQVDVDCRLLELIDKAGGLTEQANANQVNLAQKLVDQAMIVIPSLDDESTELSSSQSALVQTPEEADGKININKATLEELTKITGIGEKKAQQIINYREEHGSFKSVEDLINVSGIGQKTVDKIKSEVSI